MVRIPFAGAPATLASKRARRIVWGVVVIFVSLLAHPLYLPALAFLLIAEDAPQSADAILVLAGGSETGGRLERGVALMNQGMAPVLILSGVNIAWRTNYADINRAHALTLGMTDERMVIVRHESHST